MQKRVLYHTDIEQLMGNALNKSNIPAVFQFPIRCRYGYILDFAIPDLKIAIECDGENWHPKNNSHDRKRDCFLKGIGWETIRFRGNEIKGDIMNCISHIKLTIRRRCKI